MIKLNELLFVNTSTHYIRLERREEIECEEVDEADVPDEIKEALGIEVKDDKRPET